MTINADLKFGKERRQEMGVKEHVPFLRHVDDHVMVTKAGFLVCVVRMGGLPFQTMDQAEINARVLNRNTTLRNLSSSRFAVYSTIIRRHITPEIEGEFDNPFVAELDARYMDALSAKSLFINEVYLTVIRRTMVGKIGWVDKALDAFRLSSAGDESREDALKELHDTVDGIVARSLAHMALESLGLPLVAVPFFPNQQNLSPRYWPGRRRRNAPATNSLAEAVPTRQLFFGRNAIEVRSADQTSSKLAAMISVKEYPPFTVPGGLDGALATTARIYPDAVFRPGRPNYRDEDHSQDR